jgi:short-subunit dehydrogenase
MMDKDYLDGSVVIITGAASGIGRELAVQAAVLGATVIAVDVNLIELDKTLLMAKALRKKIRGHKLDISDPDAIIEFANLVLPILGQQKLILINNAGVALHSGNFSDTSLKDIEWLFNINFWGAVRLTKAFYPYFIAQNEGHIVNISSVFGLAGIAYQTAYSPSKFAIRGFTESLRMELIGTGIRTTSVHPGGIKTNITRNARAVDRMVKTHREITDRFDSMAGTSPQKAAQKILNAIKKKKARLLIGPDAVLLDFIVRLLPARYTKLVKAQVERMFFDPYKILEKKL